jgi:hypothetical protein
MHEKPAAQLEDQQISDDGIINVEQTEIAQYICDMCCELAVMAKNANMPMLLYLLRLAAAEANAKFDDSDALSR